MKRLRALRDKKGREESGLFLVQGRKMVRELLSSSFTIDTIVANEEAAAWLGDARTQILPQKELDRIGTFETGNDLIAAVHKPAPPGFRAAREGELLLALDGVRDPRNMGSLIRIADWFGVTRVINGPGCMEVWNPKAVSSTMGSLFRVEVRHVDDLVAELKQLKAHIYLADMDGTPAYEAKLQRPAVLVLGSESHGHSASVEALQARVISIPRVGGAESLNVAMAAAALCMELVRQR